MLFGRMPTEKDLTEIFEPLPADATDEAKEVRSKKLLWYGDSWLPALQDDFVEVIRYYQTAFSAVTIRGKKVPAVTVQSEAMGVLVFLNCETKWSVICPATAKNPNYQTPKKKENKNCHVTKWTDGKIGQQSGGGWDPKAYTVYDDLVGAFQEKRNQDKEAGWPFYKELLEVMRADKQITASKAPEPNKKRKKAVEQNLAPRSDRPQRKKTVTTYHFE